MAKDTEAVKSPETIEDLPESIASVPAGQPLDQAASSAVTLEDVENLIQKQFQSMKDTRIGKMETKLGDMEGAIAKYEALKGGTVDPKALGKLQSDQENQDLKARLDVLEGGNKPVPSAGAGEIDWGGKQASILENAGIAKDDPRIVELLRTAESKQDFVTKLEEQSFAWRQADAKKPQPSPSTVASTMPSVVPTEGEFRDMSTEAIGDKVIELAKNYTANESVILAMNAEVARRDTQQG